MSAFLFFFFCGGEHKNIYTPAENAFIRDTREIFMGRESGENRDRHGWQLLNNITRVQLEEEEGKEEEEKRKFKLFPLLFSYPAARNDHFRENVRDALMEHSTKERCVSIFLDLSFFFLLI